jgi:hypothetical protein
LNLKRHANENDYVQQAFVSFFDMKYLGLISSVIEAVHLFSKQPILLFAISPNAFQFKEQISMMQKGTYDRLITLYVRKAENHVYFDKLRVALLAKVGVGIILEADTIVTRNADYLFPLVQRKSGVFPLLPRHPDLRPETCCRGCCSPLNYSMSKRSMPYMHAHMMYSEQAKSFISNILMNCLQNPASFECESDELALNVGLWNANVTTQLCTMDPYYGSKSFFYKSKPLESQSSITAYMFLHGAKRPHEAEQVVSELKLINSSLPWVYFQNEWSVTPKLALQKCASCNCIL